MLRLSILFTLLFATEAAMAVEQPHYQVVDKLGDVQIRQYEPMNVARTRVTGNFADAGNKAFRRLAGYIFGGNAGDQRIAMTAPVSQSPVSKAGDSYWVTFMMPAKYHLEDLPKPKNGDIELVHLPAQTMAAVRYRGGWSEALYRKNLAKLKTALDKSPVWKITGEPSWARYNSPMMLPMFRTNEVLLPVTRVNETQKPE